ncbi:MAG: hypothetical protein PHC52_00600 [Syntrophales bacterium]|nr:hypothetical protein [Syntrophales bacterium]
MDGQETWNSDPYDVSGYHHLKGYVVSDQAGQVVLYWFRDMTATPCTEIIALAADPFLPGLLSARLPSTQMVHAPFLVVEFVNAGGQQTVFDLYFEVRQS